MLQSIISRHQHELPCTTRPQAHAAVNFEGGQWQKLNNFLRTEQQAFGALSLCAAHRLRAALHEGAFLGFLPLLLSLKSLCHRVACPALTALWLSRDTLFVAPFCHGRLSLLRRRRAFVMWHPLLSTTRYMSRESRLGGRYLTIACLCATDHSQSLAARQSWGKLCSTQSYRHIYICARTT